MYKSKIRCTVRCRFIYYCI